MAYLSEHCGGYAVDVTGGARVCTARTQLECEMHFPRVLQFYIRRDRQQQPQSSQLPAAFSSSTAATWSAFRVVASQLITTK